MDDTSTVPAIVHDNSSDYNDMDEMLQKAAQLKGDPNASMDRFGNHHTVIDDEDDEYDDEMQNKQEPNVVTWFTFFSHREQREYYYEPISGTTTWIAPSQTIYDTIEVDDDDNTIDGNSNQTSPSRTTTVITNIISRLPGSPMLHESIQNQMNHAITISNQIHQNHIIPVITKRPIAIVLFVCNIVFFSIWLRSFHIFNSGNVALDATHGMNATLTTNNILQMITKNTTNSSLQIVDESQLMMSSKTIRQPPLDDIYPEDENVSTTTIDIENTTISDVTYVPNDTSSIEKEDMSTEINSDDDMNLTDEIVTDNLHANFVQEEELNLKNTDVNFVGEETIDTNQANSTDALPLTSESMSDTDEILHNSTNNEAPIAPTGETQDISLEFDTITDTDTNEHVQVIAAGTSRDSSIPSASLVSQPDKQLDTIPDASEPDLMVVTETNDTEILTISEDLTNLTTTPDDSTSSDATDNDGTVDYTTNEDVVVDVEEKNTILINTDELDRYEAIQKEALLVVQRVGMNAINAGYMIELEPDLTNTTGVSSNLDADFYTTNSTWI